MIQDELTLVIIFNVYFVLALYTTTVSTVSYCELFFVCADTECSTGLQIQLVKFISRQTERCLNFVSVMKTFTSKVQKKHEMDTIFCTVVVLNLGPGVLE